MALLYPETSPTAPVTRDDIARLMTLQAMQEQGVSNGQPGDTSSPDLGALMGSGVPGFNDGQPSPSPGSTPGVPGALSEMGALTTANASMVGNNDFGNVSTAPAGFNGASMQAAMSNAANNAMGDMFGANVQDNTSTQSFGPGVPGSVGTFGFTGNMTDNANQSLSDPAVSAPAGAPGGGRSAAGGRGGFTGAVDYTMDFNPEGGFSPTGSVPGSGRAAVVAEPVAAPPADAPLNPNTPHITVNPNSPREAPANAPPPGGRTFATTQPDFVAPTSDVGSIAPGGTGFGPGAYGGYSSGHDNTGGFGAGYSGSADMGNTQGAAGFTAGAPGGGFDVGAGSFSGGGAVGGFGGDGAGDGAGAGAGAGAGDGGGSSAGGSDGASGGVG